MYQENVLEVTFLISTIYSGPKASFKISQLSKEKQLNFLPRTLGVGQMTALLTANHHIHFVGNFKYLNNLISRLFIFV